MVPRGRLADLVDRAVEHPVTLVAAPAGWGKTALLSTWAHARRESGSPVAWLTLGPDDDHRRRFWMEFVAALGEASERLSRLAVPPRGDVDLFLPALVEELSKLDHPVFVVLDELHELPDGAALADLEALVENCPDALRLVVSTRADPPLRLERLRLTGRLAEIRERDLRFTLDETGELLALLGVDLMEADTRLLWERTEGWPAGLGLAGLALENHDDPHAFVAAFAGNERTVSDYLLTEVVDRQSPETLEFLLRTCIVERLTGDLADVLTESSGGERKLEELVRGSGMVTAEGLPGSYRYHGLFTDVLRLELRRRLPEELSELHRRAGRWYARERMAAPALHHATTAEDWPLVAETLGDHWLAMVMAGEGQLLRELLTRLPEELIEQDAEVALALAGGLLDDGQDARADEYLLRAHRHASGLPEARARRFRVTSTATMLYRARLRGDLEETLSTARELLSQPWQHSVAHELRALVLANLGVAEFWAGELDIARDHLREAAGLAAECGSDYVRFQAEAYAAGLEVAQGRIAQGERRAEVAIRLAQRRGWTALPAAAMAYQALASIHIYRNELDVAQRLVERSRAGIVRSPERFGPLSLALVQARLLIARGEPLTALDALRGGLRAAGEGLPSFLAVTSAMFEAELHELLGDSGRARETLERLDAMSDGSDAALGLARLELSGGRPGAAVRHVAEFFGDERRPVRAYAAIEGWLLDALARDALHDEEGALRSIEAAMDLAEPRGFRNLLVRYGAPVRSLIRRRIERGTAHRAFAGSVLAALNGDGNGHGRPPAPLLDPLSERELAVLRFLPTMLSNAEIAGELFVSVNTVKTHVKHVYRKLDVNDRRSAVERARELQLLSA
jgi:LuxR family maltose regulon positive regulatory protein